jgi:hypothetical protein
MDILQNFKIKAMEYNRSMSEMRRLAGKRGLRTSL